MREEGEREEERHSDLYIFFVIFNIVIDIIPQRKTFRRRRGRPPVSSSSSFSPFWQDLEGSVRRVLSQCDRTTCKCEDEEDVLRNLDILLYRTCIESKEIRFAFWVQAWT
jgi:hypothetical protein